RALPPENPPLNPTVGLFPSESSEPLPKHRYALLCFRIALRECVQESDPLRPVWLLRASQHRPNSRAAKARNELAPSHLQSSSFKIGGRKLNFRTRQKVSSLTELTNRDSTK